MSAFHPKQTFRRPASNSAPISYSSHMRTRLSICQRKVSYRSEEKALLGATNAGLDLRPYRCDRCRLIHLTSRTKGKRRPRSAASSLLGSSCK
jgi:hypothetical protein